LDTAVSAYFNEGKNFKKLVAELTLALHPAIEEAVKALTAVNKEMRERLGEVAILREELASRMDELEQFLRRNNF